MIEQLDEWADLGGEMMVILFLTGFIIYHLIWPDGCDK